MQMRWNTGKECEIALFYEAVLMSNFYWYMQLWSVEGELKNWNPHSKEQKRKKEQPMENSKWKTKEELE
jgi:hypothetical protein